MKKIVAGIISVIIVIFISYIAISMGGFYKIFTINHFDPVIQKAAKECGYNGDAQKILDCYVPLALENKKPEICSLSNLYVDNLCVQSYYEQRNSTDSCNEIRSKFPGMYKNCLDYYT